MKKRHVLRSALLVLLTVVVASSVTVSVAVGTVSLLSHSGILKLPELFHVSGGSGQNIPTGEEGTEERVGGYDEADNLCVYNFTQELFPDAHIAKCKLVFTYVNNEDRAMDELHFSLFANSYSDPAYGIFSEADMVSAYPNGFSEGGISINSISGSDGIRYYIGGEQKQTLVVELAEKVEKGDTTEITMEYMVRVPNCWGRFGYGDDTISMVNCNPILNVYGEGKWYDCPYSPITDPFYNEVADYYAVVSAPSEYTLAFTGGFSQETNADKTVWTVSAPARRDFGYVASDSFVVCEETTDDGVKVYSYAKDADLGRKVASAAGDALELFGERYAEYPYKYFSVVQTDFFIGGMEYPGMVLIDTGLYSPKEEGLLELVTVHEAAHQWFYALVGSNQITEPWLDESFAEFSTNMYFEEHPNASTLFYTTYTNSYYKSIRQMTIGVGVDSPGDDFPELTAYSAWVYARGAEILSVVREKMGDTAFFGALREYCTQYRLGLADAEDLFRILNEYCPEGFNAENYMRSEFDLP